MKKIQLYILVALVGLLASCGGAQEPAQQPEQTAAKPTTLKEAFKGKFLLGTALNGLQISGKDSASMQVAVEQFNSIVAENDMKSMYLQPKEGEFFFDTADKFVALGEKHGMAIIGHTLIWHSQAPAWLFVDDKGNDVSREVLIERLEKHITTVVSRYKGRILGWDVVNEAIEDDGSWRKSKFYQIIGEEFIALAFKFAHKADPDVELYYNDYSMDKPGKREGVVRMVKSLQEQGIKISGIGMQSHVGLEHPDMAEYEKSLLAFSELGVKVMVTELDMGVLPHPSRNLGADIAQNFELKAKLNPYTEGLPDSVAQLQAQRYIDLFKLYLKYQDKISRVTLWGINDQMTWRNGWPVRGRTDYPLLFNRDNTPKPVVQQLIDLAKQP